MSGILFKNLFSFYGKTNFFNIICRSGLYSPGFLKVKRGRRGGTEGGKEGDDR